MKTHLLYDATDELYEIARLGAEYRAAVDEMLDYGMLIDSGNLLDTELGMLNKRQRITLMRRTGQEGWLRISERPFNLVFVFKGISGKGVHCLLHAVDRGHGWRLRLIYCDLRDRYVFCPIEGHLDYGCTGMSVSAWPLGGDAGKASGDTVACLMDIALTGFARMRRQMTIRQAKNRMLFLTPELSSAWAELANACAGTD